MAGGAWVAEVTGEGDAATVIQPAVGQALERVSLRLAGIAAFAVNLGPGSVLGIRASILSARAWSELQGKPMLGWSGHLAAAWAAAGTCDGVVSEGRAGMLNVQRLDANGPVGDLAELESSALAGLRTRPIHGGFRHPSALPLAEEVDAWHALPSLFAQHDLLVQVERPDALNSPATYALWSGQRHQGGSA